MEKFEQYGDLTQEEYYSFLAEIESEDDSLREAEESSEQITLQEEAQSSLCEDPENAEIEALFGDDAWRKLNDDAVLPFDVNTKRKAAQASSKLQKAKNYNIRADKINIQRQAFAQQKLDLSTPIEKGELKVLVGLLVRSHTLMIEKHTAFINSRLTRLLRPFIPQKLRNCKMQFPDAVRISPGFLYQASAEYGENLTFWATPDIPYYFKQNTEQEILIKNKAPFLYAVDKAIVARQKHLEKRAEKEILYATTLMRKNVKTYFDLLKLNPFWFETLYKEVVKE